MGVPGEVRCKQDQTEQCKELENVGMRVLEMGAQEGPSGQCLLGARGMAVAG